MLNATQCNRYTELLQLVAHSTEHMSKKHGSKMLLFTLWIAKIFVMDGVFRIEKQYEQNYN